MTIDAETFVDAATRVCGAAADLGTGAAVTLHRANGPTMLVVDNFASATDELRRWSLTEEAWRVNPMLIELRRQLAILGPEVFDLPTFNALARDKGFAGLDQQPLGVPLLGAGGWFGCVTYSARVAPSAATERELLVLATELSVWCAARGISTLPDARPLAPRQREVAALAADGRTNPEIADALGISINTVKLRLKQAFDRLGVDNRTELANVLRRLAPLDGVAPGITRRETVTITRGVPDRVLDR
jgi:DNA-binding CsgD family transcriptional regulator